MSNKSPYTVTGKVVVLVLLLAGLLVLALQSKKVQSAVVSRVLSALGSSLPEGRIECGSVSIGIGGTVVLKDIAVIDNNPSGANLPGWAPVDTLISARRISASFSLAGIFDIGSGDVRLRRVEADGATLNLVMENSDRQAHNLARVFGIAPPAEVPEEIPWAFSTKVLVINNFRYTMRSVRPDVQPHEGPGIDWNDLDVTASAKARNFGLKNSYYVGKVEHLEAVEKTGYRIKELRGSIKIGMGIAEIDDLLIEDTWSRLDLPHFYMTPGNLYGMMAFSRQTVLDAEIRPCTLSARTICAYSGALAESTQAIVLGCPQVSGTINDIKVRNLFVNDAETGVGLCLNGGIKGLMDIPQVKFDLAVSDAKFTPGGMVRTLRKSGIRPPKPLDVPEEKFKLDLGAEGDLDSLVVKLGLGSDHGTASAAVTLFKLTSGSPSVTGTVRADDLDVAPLLGLKDLDFLGPVTFDIAAEGHTARDGSLFARLKSLDVRKLTVLDYSYTNIHGSGTLSKGVFNGKLVAMDPNAYLMFNGSAPLAAVRDTLDYNFDLHIGKANLSKLGLIETEAGAKLSAVIKANFKKIRGLGSFGDLRLDDLMVYALDGESVLEPIHIKSAATDDGFRIGINTDGQSKLGRITYTGKEFVGGVISSLSKNHRCSDFRLDINLDDTKELLDFFVPGTSIAPGTSLTAESADGRIAANLSSANLKYTTKTGTSIAQANVEADITFADDKFTVDYSGEDSGMLSLTSDLHLNGQLNPPGGYALSIGSASSKIMIGGTAWNISDFLAHIGADGAKFENLSLDSEGQTISVTGGCSNTRSDTLGLSIDGFKLSDLDGITKGEVHFDGSLYGQFRLITPTTDRLDLEGNLSCRSVGIGGEPVGDLELTSRWAGATERVPGKLKSTLVLHDGQKNTLHGSFDYTPAKENEHPDDVEAFLSVDDISLKHLNSFLAGTLDFADGSLKGGLTAMGRSDSLAIGGRIHLNSSSVSLIPAGTAYAIDGDIKFKNDSIKFDSIKLLDPSGHEALLTGSLTSDYLKDFRLDASLALDSFEVIDLPYSADGFYGSLCLSGDAGVRGSFDNLSITGDISSAPGSKLHVPISGSATAKTTEILSFAQPVIIDVEEETTSEPVPVRKERKGRTDIHAAVHLTPDLEIMADIDRANGSVISGYGTGDITGAWNLSQSSLPTLTGEYRLQDGNFHFDVPGSLIARDFEIQSGSQVTFGGSLKDISLDITTCYVAQRTPLDPLISESLVRDVNCLISLSGKVSDPAVNFDVQVQDLDAKTESLVSSELDTQDKRDKQFVALLLTNSFLQGEQSGISSTGSNNMLLSNVSNIVANQINNILGKLDIPVDLGMSYLVNDSGQDVFDVAVKTQLFDNRVIVGGSVGNRQYSSYSDDEMVGDVDIEIKLDKSGNTRLNLFSHSADDYTNYLDNTQRNGAGITYQQEYNSFAELFRRIFGKNKEDSATTATASRKITIKADEGRKRK